MVNGSMKLSAPIGQSNASMFIMVGGARRRAVVFEADAGSSEGRAEAACQRRFEWIYETFLSWASVRFPRLFSSCAAEAAPPSSLHQQSRLATRGRAARWGDHTRGFSAALQPTKRMCVAAENAEGRRT